MNTDKKYIMIVTKEDERYGKEVQLDFYADRPWEGLLSNIVFGDNIEELMESGNGCDNGGLFYMLYANESGTRIGSGIVEWDSIQEEIVSYETSISKRYTKDELFSLACNGEKKLLEQISKIANIDVCVYRFGFPHSIFMGAFRNQHWKLCEWLLKRGIYPLASELLEIMEYFLDKKIGG